MVVGKLDQIRSVLAVNVLERVVYRGAPEVQEVVVASDLDRLGNPLQSDLVERVGDSRSGSPELLEPVAISIGREDRDLPKFRQGFGGRCDIAAQAASDQGVDLA